MHGIFSLAPISNSDIQSATQSAVAIEIRFFGLQSFVVRVFWKLYAYSQVYIYFNLSQYVSYLMEANRNCSC
jgi:hypothetical protein